MYPPPSESRPVDPTAPTGNNEPKPADTKEAAVPAPLAGEGHESVPAQPPREESWYDETEDYPRARYGARRGGRGGFRRGEGRYRSRGWAARGNFNGNGRGRYQYQQQARQEGYGEYVWDGGRT